MCWSDVCEIKSTSQARTILFRTVFMVGVVVWVSFWGKIVLTAFYEGLNSFSLNKNKYVIVNQATASVGTSEEDSSNADGGDREDQTDEQGVELSRVEDLQESAGGEQIFEQSSIAETIKQVAQEEGFEDWKLLERIMFCESSLKVDEYRDGDYWNYSVNPTNGSMDRGFAQISAKWNPHISDETAYSLKGSVRFLSNEINAGKLWKWNASRGCWSQRS